jgi:hypothetical protein
MFIIEATRLTDTFRAKVILVEQMHSSRVQSIEIDVNTERDRANLHFQVIPCTTSFDMGLTREVLPKGNDQ